jgi:2,4-dienoyl-CoA reductase (NADPH2)
VKIVKYRKLFTPVQLGTLTLPNRIVMAPMETNLANENSYVTEQLMDHYRRRAATGVGLVIVENTSVSSDRKVAPKYSLAIYDDAFIDGLSRLVHVVHEEGSKIFLQLGDYLFGIKRRPAELSSWEIDVIVDDFVTSAERAKFAGFDGVEFHMAHRYTIADFLSKYANTRSDEYGQDVEGKAKIAKVIVTKTKKRLGNDYPVVCRLNGDEFMVGGNTLKDSILISNMLETAGADAIHVSAGGRIENEGVHSYSSYRQVPTSDMPDAVNVYLAKEIKKKISIPTIAVGKIGNLDLAESIVDSNQADMVAFGRPLLADPELVSHSQSDSPVNQCIWCNNCVRLLLKGRPVECLTYRRASLL